MRKLSVSEILKIQRKSEKQRKEKKKRRRRNLRYVIQCFFSYYTSYARIYTHRVIERDEFSSRINVDHSHAQNKVCHRY